MRLWMPSGGTQDLDRAPLTADSPVPQPRQRRARRPPRTDPLQPSEPNRGPELPDGEDEYFLTLEDDELAATELHRESFVVTLAALTVGQDYLVRVEHANIGAWSKLTHCRVTPDCDLTKIWISRIAQGDDDTLYLGLSLASDIDAGTYGGPGDLQLTIVLEGFFFTAGPGGAATAVAFSFLGLTADFVLKAGDTMTGRLVRPVSSPAQITVDQNDYALPATGHFVRLTTDAARTITGFAATSTGDEVEIVNAGAFNLVIANQHVSSAAANRVITGTGVNITMLPDENVKMVYDGTTARWRVL